MFAVIFEVCPKAGHWDDYLGYARLLKPELEGIDGFIENERFASKRREGWLVSLSTWRDEKALVRWRTHALHHDVQMKGRTEVFRDYHLRVGEITADTRLPAGAGLEQQRYDETAVGSAKIAVLTEIPLDQAGAAEGADLAAVEWDLFESITRPGRALILSFWRNAEAAGGWLARPALRQRTVRVIRDYGMFSRAEAPQYYPPISSATPQE